MGNEAAPRHEYAPTGGRWSVDVPVDADEAGIGVADVEWRGSKFAEERLRVFQPWSDSSGPAAWSISGLNIRADNTTGRRRLRRRVPRTDIEADYPRTYARAVEELDKLTKSVTADALATVGAIRKVMAGTDGGAR
jgi:hypothetical protein